MKDISDVAGVDVTMVEAVGETEDVRALPARDGLR
jgi:hypothetical protein